MRMTQTEATLLRPHPELDWSPEGPRARGADDVYFSVENGLEETRAVFLAGCGLPGGFAGREVFVIGELGFGTGLNFLAAWDLFRRTAPAGARLHFVSVEGWPLRRADAARALAAFPELERLAASLIAAWPAPRKGAHRRVFEGGRVTLTVFQDEALAALSNMEMTADAWFLDGFAPAKNPQMWSQGVLAEIARMSRRGTRLSTFTVAGAVRRGLADQGFSVAKVPGFGRKRERLEAVFDTDPPGPVRSPFARLEASGGPVAIIGGGIGAASLVHALRLRGKDAVVFAEGGLAAGASGAPSGLFTPRLEAADRPHVRATLAAFDYARGIYEKSGAFAGEGVLRLARDDADRLARLAAMLGEEFTFVEEAAARRATGLDEAGAGLWMASAGRFDPAALVRALTGGADVRGQRVAQLERTQAGWHLLGAAGEGLYRAETVLLACGAGLSGFSDITGLDVERTAGRVGVFETPDGPPAAPVAWGHYLGATPAGRLLVGATHVKGADPGSPEAGGAALTAALAEAFPGLAARLGEQLDSWAGVRAAFADRLPAAGGVPGPDFDAIWGEFARGGPLPAGGADALEPGIGVLGGFGARGFAHAPLLAEALVSDLFAEPSPLERAGRQVLHPARFVLRALRRG